jgi:hypothetical protein
MRCAILFASLAAATGAAAKGIWATPHDSYSSSIGVLGCKINTDRVAYWPQSVDCTNICVSVSYEGRTVYLLRIDQSGGAYDMSYDAWNYLVTGYGASEKPTAGGAIAMETENVDISYCASLIYTDGNKLPLSAPNSMNFLASCISQANSWVSQNYALYNILDSICTWGKDEECALKDFPNQNQPSCPDTLGAPVVLTSAPVYNIQYPTGNKVLASSGQIVANATGTGGTIASQRNMAQKAKSLTIPIVVLTSVLHWALFCS